MRYLLLAACALALAACAETNDPSENRHIQGRHEASSRIDSYRVRQVTFINDAHDPTQPHRNEAASPEAHGHETAVGGGDSSAHMGPRHSTPGAGERRDSAAHGVGQDHSSAGGH